MSRSGIAWSEEVRLLRRPEAGYRRLAQDPDRPSGIWWRRPALFLLTVGSMISLLTAGRLTVPLVVEACLAWSFVPALHIAAAAAIARFGPRGRRSLRWVLDLYFMGFGPWLLWMMALCGAALFVPASGGAWKISTAVVLGGTSAAFLWSAWINLGFFRGALTLSLPRAALAVVAVRAWCWGFFVVYLYLSDQLLPRLPWLPATG